MTKDARDSRSIEQKDMINQLNMVISSQNELIMSLRGTVEECNSTIAGLREQVEYLTGKLFGTSSEKSRNIKGQLSLLDEAEQEAQPLDEPQGLETVIAKENTCHTRRTGNEIFNGVPSRDEVLLLSEEQKHCPDCGTEMKVIAKELVRREFRFTPAKGEVVTGKQQNARNAPLHLPWPETSGL